MWEPFAGGGLALTALTGVGMVAQPVVRVRGLIRGERERAAVAEGASGTGQKPGSNGVGIALGAGAAFALIAAAVMLIPQADGPQPIAPVEPVMSQEGADATVEEVTDQVALAGGTLAGRYAAQPALVDVGEKSLVDTLGSQLMTQLESASVTSDAPTYERIGELLGLAITTTDVKGAEAPGPEASAVSQALEGAALVSLATEEPVRAPYLLVLLGPDTEAADDPIYAGLLTGLARRAVGVVVASDAADGDAGRLGRLRDDPATGTVATVDGIEAAPGQVTAMLALASWPQTKGGAFGASGADGAVTLR